MNEIRIPSVFRGWITDPPPPAVLLGGEGAGLAEMVAELLRARLGQGGGGVELLRLGAMDMERASPVPEWRTPSLFCRFRVYLLPDCGELRKDPRGELRDYLESPAPNVVLVLPCTDRNAMRTLSAIPGVRSSSLREDQADRILAEYCRGTARDAGKEMAEEVALFLVRWTGGDYSRIRSEMGKLLGYTGDRKEIGEGDIRQVCIAGGSVDPFRMAEDLIHGRREACIEQFRRFARTAEPSDYHALVGAIAWTVRSRTVGQKVSPRGKPVTLQRAGAVLSALASIDAGLKGGSGFSPEQFFEIRMLSLLA